MPASIHGKLLCDAPSLLGYSVRLTYLDSSSTAPPNSGKSETHPGEQSPGSNTGWIQITVPVAADGTFQAALPNKIGLEITAAVISPAGESIAQDRRRQADLEALWEIPVNAVPARALTKPDRIAPNRKARLSGRILDRTGANHASGLQVLLVARSEATGSEAPLLLARSDREGYFSGPLPDQSFDSVTAVVGVNGTSQRVSLGLVQGRLPNPIILVIDQAVEPNARDTACGCQGGAVLRAPDPGDLVQSPESFSRDAGGCADFTAPNRVVEEFSYYALVRSTTPTLRSFVQNSPHERQRLPLDLNWWLDWENWSDTARRSEAATISVGHLLQFRQVWRADGYSLGDLVYSLPLAPCEKKQIAVVDWTRRTEGQRADSTAASEQITAALTRDRDIREIVGSTVGEMLRGESGAVTGGLAAGGGYSSGTAVIGVAGGVGGAYATADQNGSRTLAGQMEQRIRDVTLQSASAVRSARSTVVQQVAEGERTEVQTSTVHNHNHCHAITIQYFEVLRHFQVTQEIGDVRECLFVPLPIRAFEYSNLSRLLAWREVLARSLRDPSLAGAFDAAARIRSAYANSVLPDGRYSQQPIADIYGDITIAFELPEPFHYYDEDVLGQSSYDEQAWYPLAVFLDQRPRAWHEQYVAKRSREERAQNWRDIIAPRIAERFAANLTYDVRWGPEGSALVVSPLPLEGTLVSTRYDPATPMRIALRRTGDLRPMAREELRSFGVTPGDFFYFSSPFRAVLHSVSLRYRTASFEYDLVRDYVADAALPGATNARIPGPEGVVRVPMSFLSSPSGTIRGRTMRNWSVASSTN